MKGFNRIDNQQTKDSKGCHLTINPNHAAMATSVSRATNQSEMKLQEGYTNPEWGGNKYVQTTVPPHVRLVSQASPLPHGRVF